MKLSHLTKSIIAISLSALMYTGANAADLGANEAFNSLNTDAIKILKDSKIDINALLSNESNDLIVNFNQLTHQINSGDNTGKTIATRRFKAVKESVKSLLNDTVVIRDYYGSPTSFYRVGSLKDLVTLLNNTDVESVTSNVKSEVMLEESLDNIKQPEVSEIYLNTPSGGRHYLTGEGSVIAVLDTGLNYNQPGFGNCRYRRNTSSCNVIDVLEFGRDSNGTYDNQLDDAPSTHGTNVSAIAIGVAPKAKVIGLDVFGKFYDRVEREWKMTADDADINAGLNWIANNHISRNSNGLNIVSLNMSLGVSRKEFSPTNRMPILGTLKNMGVAAAVASGNDYFSDAIAYPSSERAAISVGAVHDTANRWTSSYCGSYGTKYGQEVNEPVCFSNSSRLLDILAPGYQITAGGVRLSGTSMASPHVAGALAVYRSPAMLNFRNDSVDDTLNRLQQGGVSVRDFRNGLVQPKLDMMGVISTY